MAIETLKEIEVIGEFPVARVDWRQNKDQFIEINDLHNAITFKLQDGPIKENGINGCQVDTMIEAAMMIIQGLNEKFPCFENDVAVLRLEEALLFLEKRKTDRTQRGVEGTNQN